MADVAADPGKGSFTPGGTRQDVGKASNASTPARDVVGIVLGFARTLRHAGVAASPDRVEAMLSALGALDVLDPTDVYWAGRLTLCARTR